MPTLSTQELLHIGGYLTGATLYAMLLVAAARENWVRADTEALAFHAERLSRGTTPQPTVAAHSAAREEAERGAVA